MNKIENKALGKTLRTIGFILILLTSILLFNSVIRELNIKTISDILKPLDNLINKLYTKVKFLKNYEFLILTSGLLLLLWTQTRSWFLRGIVTAIGLFTLLAAKVSFPTEAIIPFIKLSSIPGFVTKIVNISPWITLGFIILSLFPIYLVLAYREKDKFSTKVVSSGILIMIIAISLTFLYINVGFFRTNIVVKITLWTFLVGYLLNVIGSVFGILGFYSK